MYTLKKGDNIGAYTVTFQLKEGRGADSYRVKDASGNNRYLKLIDHSRLLASQKDREGRITEVEVAKRLDHPNLMKYLDGGNVEIDGGRYSYLVFDFISGETLGQFLTRKGGCSVYEAREIVSGILHGLDYLQSMGDPIVHGAVSLSNVMMDARGGKNTARIIDYGNARFLSQGGMPYEKSDEMPVFYVPSESFNGDISLKTDVFSAGAILYNLIFGIPPYFVELGNCAGEIGRELRKVDLQRGRQLHIPNVNKFELDENLINVMRKALATDPADRFENAQEFLSALNGEIEVEKVENRKLSPSNAVYTRRVEPKVVEGQGFSAIAGMQELKDQMQTEVIDALRSPEEYARYGLTIPNGMLLYGPPGCGKTFFAKHFAEEVGYNYMYIKPSSLQSKWVNATQENIAQMFRDAEENAPTIIFIDEMNELAPNRSDRDVHEMSRSAVNELLAQMDRTGERGIFIIGATNKPDMMDPAILRSGRLDKKYYIGAPDREARKAMFELYLKSRPVEEALDYYKLADLTKNYVSSDIELIVNEASRLAMKSRSDITLAILETAISSVRPSLSAAELSKYEEIKAKMEGEDPNSSRRYVGFR